MVPQTARLNLPEKWGPVTLSFVTSQAAFCLMGIVPLPQVLVQAIKEVVHQETEISEE